MNVLTDVAWLSQHLDDDDVVLLEVRWTLGDPHGHRHYLAGHLPGAVYVDLDTELAAPPSPAQGRHPLPGVANLQAAARDWGVRQSSAVVVYDDCGGAAAARAWWLLRWAGVAGVSLLDGGLGCWRSAGLPLTEGDITAPSGDVVLTPGHLPVIGAAEAAQLAHTPGAVLLDARAAERYRGETEPIDPRAGHIPGALSAPAADSLGTDGRLLAADALRARFAELGVRPGTATAVYCGSGVTAAHQIAALAHIGLDAALYPGSWSQWSADPAREAATGQSG